MKPNFNQRSTAEVSAYDETPGLSGLRDNYDGPAFKPGQLNKALASFQSRLPKIGKGETGTVSGKTKDGKPYSYTYKYADLSDISPIVLQMLGEEGLAWVCCPTWEDGRFFLRYALRHESGEEVGGLYPLHFDGGPQDVGKEITYARRYALCAVTGIAPGDDDDGASAQRASRPAPGEIRRGSAAKARAERRAPNPDAQRRKYHKMREQLGWDEDAGHDFINDLSKGRATRWTDLDERQRGVVLDAMGERIRELGREPEGPLVPEGVNPETGEVKGAPEDRDDWTPGWPPQDSEDM